MKDALGHGSNGRGGPRKLAKPLPGHPYHQKSDAELRYIAKDAGEAAEAMRGHSPDAENKYLDQVNDAASVLGYRRRGGAQDLGLAAANALASGPKSGPEPAHGGMSSAPGSVGYNDQRVGSRGYDAFGRSRSDESKSEYDAYNRDLALRSRNGGIGSGGRR